MVGAIIGYTEVLPAENVLQTAFKKLGAKRRSSTRSTRRPSAAAGRSATPPSRAEFELSKKNTGKRCFPVFFIVYHTCKFSVNATRYSSESGAHTAKARRSRAGFSVTSERERQTAGIAMRYLGALSSQVAPMAIT